MLKKFFIGIWFVFGSISLYSNYIASQVILTLNKEAKLSGYAAEIVRPGSVELPFWFRSFRLRKQHLIPAGDKGLCLRLLPNQKVVISAVATDPFTLGFWKRRPLGLPMLAGELPDSIAGHVDIKWNKSQLIQGKSRL